MAFLSRFYALGEITPRTLDGSRDIGKIFRPIVVGKTGIERPWKQKHDHVIRNHRHTTMQELMKAVFWFLRAVQPFPGTQFFTLTMAAGKVSPMGCRLIKFSVDLAASNAPGIPVLSLQAIEESG